MGVVVENETEYVRFVELGDRLFMSSRLASITGPKTTRIGEGYFWVMEGDHPQPARRGHVDQPHDDVRLQPRRARAARRGRRRRPRASARRPRTRSTPIGAPTSRPDQRVFWDDVAEGDELPTLVMPITVTRCIYLASATRDFSPHHSNRDYAQQQVGARDMFLNTPFNTGILSRFVTEWGGPASRVRKLKLAMRENVCAGDDMIIDGHVVRKFEEDGEHFVDIDIQVSTQDGPKYTAGATLMLPAFRRYLVSDRLRDRCAIVGIGNTAYTRGTEQSTPSCTWRRRSVPSPTRGSAPQDIDGIMPNDVAGRLCRGADGEPRAPGPRLQRDRAHRRRERRRVDPRRVPRDRGRRRHLRARRRGPPRLLATADLPELPGARPPTIAHAAQRSPRSTSSSGPTGASVARRCTRRPRSATCTSTARRASTSDGSRSPAASTPT